MDLWDEKEDGASAKKPESEPKSSAKKTDNETKSMSKDKPRAKPKKVVIDDFKSGRGKVKSEFSQNFETTSFIWRITALILLVGFLCHVIAYGAPYWLCLNDVSSGEGRCVGIWNNCTTNIKECIFREDASVCLNAVRAFGGLSVVCDLLAFLLLNFYIRRPGSRRCLSVTTVVVCFISALSIQCSMGIFGRHSACIFDLDGSSAIWGWSMAVSFLGLLFTCAAGLLFLIQELRGCSGRRKHGLRRRRRNNLGLNIT